MCGEKSSEERKRERGERMGNPQGWNRTEIKKKNRKREIEERTEMERDVNMLKSEKKKKP